MILKKVYIISVEGDDDMNDKTISFEKEGQSCNGNIVFNGFCFPKISSLVYSLDGPDKLLPDRLFIQDKFENFIISIEKGTVNMPCMNNPDYENFEIKLADRILRFCYPLPKGSPKIKMGYFTIIFTNECNKDCYGQLNIISTENSYMDTLLKYPELIALLQGLKVYNP